MAGHTALRVFADRELMQRLERAEAECIDLRGELFDARDARVHEALQIFMALRAHDPHHPVLSMVAMSVTRAWADASGGELLAADVVMGFFYDDLSGRTDDGTSSPSASEGGEMSS